MLKVASTWLAGGVLSGRLTPCQAGRGMSGEAHPRSAISAYTVLERTGVSGDPGDETVTQYDRTAWHAFMSCSVR